MTQKGEMELTVPERGSGRRPRLRTPPLFSCNRAPGAPTPSDQTTRPRPPRGHYRASTPRQKQAGQAGSNVKAVRDARDQGCHFLHLPVYGIRSLGSSRGKGPGEEEAPPGRPGCARGSPRARGGRPIWPRAALLSSASKLDSGAPGAGQQAPRELDARPLPSTPPARRPPPRAL